ncbi:hypothetical protein HPB52_022430 [Rhipicephalus sanguineus]|uniref:Uncharacterized protein n=1 Tax=Rhipicephalus sanguineus TaxID=34632 RepID=A0A9D4T290_RHISA|nr:hypothetical protein HPB52_022430 [Rhipicephalus sanguineus]
MYALVRFLNSFDKKEYVVPVHNIKDFHPANKDDFNKTKVYTTLWIDEDPERTGSYTCRNLLLADSEEELHKQRSNKRLPRPVINASDIEHEELIDLDLQQPAANITAHKKLKQSQAASKSAAYDNILSQHASSALEKNKAARGSQVSIKMYEITDKKKSKKDTWQEPDEKVLRERNELRQTVAAMSQRLDSMDCKLTMILEMLQGTSVRQPQGTRTSESAPQLQGRLTRESVPPPKRAQQSPAGRSSNALNVLCQCYYFDIILNFTYYFSSAADSKATHVPFTEIGDGKTL